MSEFESPAKSGGAMKTVILVVAGLYVLASLYLLINMKGRIDALEAGQATAVAQQDKLNQRITSNEADQKATSVTLAEKMGITEKELEARTAELRRQQRASIAKLQKEVDETNQKLGELQGKKEGNQRFVMSKEQQVELEKFKQKRADANQQHKRHFDSRKNCRDDAAHLHCSAVY